MSEVFVFVLLTLVSYRLQRVVTTDVWPPSEWFRGKVASRFGEDSSWYALVECPWCIGSWITFAVFAAASVTDYVSLPLPVLQAVAGAALVGLLGEWESRA